MDIIWHIFRPNWTHHNLNYLILGMQKFALQCFKFATFWKYLRDNSESLCSHCVEENPLRGNIHQFVLPDSLQYNTTLLRKDEIQQNIARKRWRKILLPIEPIYAMVPETPVKESVSLWGTPRAPPPTPLREALSYQKTHICSLKSFGTIHNLPKNCWPPPPLPPFEY